MNQARQNHTSWSTCVVPPFPAKTMVAESMMKSSEVWTDLASWIRVLAAVTTFFPHEILNKHSRKGKSRTRTLMAAASSSCFQWYMNNARMRSFMASTASALLCNGTCGNESLHAECRGVFRQVYKVSAATSQLKLDLFKLFKQTAFDAARRIPNLLQLKQRLQTGGHALDTGAFCVSHSSQHKQPRLIFTTTGFFALGPCVMPNPNSICVNPRSCSAFNLRMQSHLSGCGALWRVSGQ